MMRIKTGVAGLTKTIAKRRNEINWHVLYADTDKFLGFFPESLEHIITEETAKGYALVQVMGNVLAFRKDDCTMQTRMYR